MPLRGCYYTLLDDHRALDAYNKCLSMAPPDWIERATALGNRAAVLVMLLRYYHILNIN